MRVGYPSASNGGQRTVGIRMFRHQVLAGDAEHADPLAQLIENIGRAEYIGRNDRIHVTALVLPGRIAVRAMVRLAGDNIFLVENAVAVMVVMVIFMPVILILTAVTGVHALGISAHHIPVHPWHCKNPSSFPALSVIR